ncbi:MAG: hypothetical protein HWN68_01600 [Desulfobacterales bacterium]|nr:hypothetical protein [Desulfobacterales bacterium]
MKSKGLMALILLFAMQVTALSNLAFCETFSPPYDAGTIGITKYPSSFTSDPNISVNSNNGTITFDVGSNEGDKGFAAIVGTGFLGSYTCNQTGIYKVEWICESGLEWSGYSDGLVPTVGGIVSAALGGAIEGIPLLLGLGTTANDVWNFYSWYQYGLGLISTNFDINVELWNATYNVGDLFNANERIFHVPVGLPFNALSPRILEPTSITISCDEVIFTQGCTYSWSWSPQAVIIQEGGTRSWAHYGGQLSLREVRITLVNSLTNALQLLNPQFPSLCDPGDSISFAIHVLNESGNNVSDAQVEYTIFRLVPDADAASGYRHVWTADGSCNYSQASGSYVSGLTAPTQPGTYQVIISASKNGHWPAKGNHSFVVRPKHSPVLSNPRVVPSSGNPDNTFEFLVDYYDQDGDAPEIHRDLYIDGIGPYTMTLKSGTPSYGTYAFQTQLQAGTHNYFFSFIDRYAGFALSPIYSGPIVHTSESYVELRVVVSGGPITNNIEIRFEHGPDLHNLKYQLWSAPALPKYLGIDSGQQLMFSVSTESESHSFTKWVFRDDEGNIVRESTASGYGFTLLSGNIHATAYLSYTPVNYTISGTALRNDGVPVPGGIDLTLSSSEQTLTHHTDDGSFSFTGVKGGVSVSVTPSAPGYDFGPATLVFNNLRANKTEQDIVAYPSDESAPITSFVTVPPSVSEDSSVSFSWTGSDDVSHTSNLFYQYKLDGVDSDCSAWTPDTSKAYDLPNGTYTFWVRGKDAAGNINEAPASYDFVVNAAPTVVSAVRVDKSVWASRVTLEMPTEAIHPTDTFVLLPEHSGMSDFELVPVRIHRADEIVPCGANEMVATELGLTVRISKVGTGWLVTLPDSIPSGQTMQYDIVWGKIEYFGWQEFVDIPPGFPNFNTEPGYTSHIEGTFLDENHHLWRLASKKRNRVSGVWGSTIAWAFMDVADQNASIIDERLHQRLQGTPFNGFYACDVGIVQGYILQLGPNVCLIWEEEEYERIGGGGDYEDIQSHRYALEIFDLAGNTVNSFDGNFREDTFIDCPQYALDNGLYVTGKTYNGGANTSDLWFVLHDSDGNEIVPRTVFESVPRTNSGDLNCKFVRTLGTKTVFLFNHYWETTTGPDDRKEIRYQVRDANGAIVKASTTLNPPLLPDTLEKNDEYQFTSALTDNEGKVWVSFEHYQSDQPYEYYYSIIGPDGNIWKGPVLLSGGRQFVFCDKDGYIWAREGGNLLVLNDDDTLAFPARQNAYLPNQNIGVISAFVDSNGDGYRLYDRWSPQLIQIDVPAGADTNSMELFDLNLWDNDLHPSNVNLKKGDTSVWSHSGQFTGYTTVDMSGTLSQGLNVFTMTQDDFMGGQVLVTFPYVTTYSIAGEITLSGGSASGADVLLTLSGASSQTTYPQASGDYSFTDLEEGYYTVTPSLTDYHFFPAFRSYSPLNSARASQSFIGLYETYDSEPDNLPDWWEQQIINADPNDDIDSLEGVNPEDDFDNDSWTNYEEYVNSTDPADDTSPVLTPPEVKETNPHHNAGIDDSTRVPNDTSFAVRIEDADGIDITDTSSIMFTINDDVDDVNNDKYTRDLSDTTVVRVVKLTEDEDTRVTKLWAVYDRSKDILGNYSYDTNINIGVDAKDRRGDWMTQTSYDFNIETETEHANAETNSPDTVPVADDDPALDDPDYIDAVGIEVTSGDLEGAKIIYDNSEPVQPILGPIDELPPFDEAGVDAVGVPMNLQPPTVFNTPVKVFIPCPGHTDVSNLSVYLYNGTAWVLASDATGMVHGSRANHQDTSPPTIKIKLYHFTGVQAGGASSPAPTPPSDDTGGGGCFIATAAYGSNMADDIVTLKEFRDNILLKNSVGRRFVRSYYEVSPPFADYIKGHESLKAAVRFGFIPLVAISYSTVRFGPVITLSMVVVLLVIPVCLVSLYRRKARSYRANN